jgi:hypothetical protein
MRDGTREQDTQAGDCCELCPATLPLANKKKIKGKVKPAHQESLLHSRILQSFPLYSLGLRRAIFRKGVESGASKTSSSLG